MTSIRYNLHFLLLIVAAFLFWLATEPYLPTTGTDFGFFYFGLMVFFHAISIVISLRNRKTARPIIALCFVTLAAGLGAVTPVLAVLSSIVWNPILDILLPRSDFNVVLIYLFGSAVGSSGYWLLMRLFWLKALRRVDWLKNVALCVAATLVSVGAVEMLNTSAGVTLLVLTVPWWFGFSISLYWSETSAYANTSAKAMADTSQQRAVVGD